MIRDEVAFAKRIDKRFGELFVGQGSALRIKWLQQHVRLTSVERGYREVGRCFRLHQCDYSGMQQCAPGVVCLNARSNYRDTNFKQLVFEDGGQLRPLAKDDYPGDDLFLAGCKTLFLTCNYRANHA